MQIKLRKNLRFLNNMFPLVGVVTVPVRISLWSVLSPYQAGFFFCSCCIHDHLIQHHIMKRGRD